MAELYSPYSLCPLIEQKKFLGVSQDSVAGCVIVTLSKNIVIRYKLSDQKQASSWSSRDKLSAPVVYDHVGQQYVGVFNGEYVALWGPDVVDLNKVKKHRYVLLIQSVVSAPGIRAQIVFRNGCVAPLDVEQRKETQGDELLPLDQEVEEARLVNIRAIHYVCLVVSGPKEECWLHFVPVDPDVGSKSRLRLAREEADVKLLGHALSDLDNAHLVTFWSDRKVLITELPVEGETQGLPGRFVSQLDCISPSLPVAIVPISPLHIALYGANDNSEGALLLIYNTKFGVVETQSEMKMYTEPARLWRCGTGQVVLIVGQYLGVAPYRLGTPRLAALLGAHAAPSAQREPVAQPLWGLMVHKKQPPQPPEVPTVRDLRETLAHMTAAGMSERAMCEEVVGGLMATEDVEGLEVLVAEVEDMPQRERLAVLRLSAELLPASRGLLVSLLRRPPDDGTAALGAARSCLDLAAAARLLDVLTQELAASPTPPLVLWASLLLDSHYQQYLLARDPNLRDTLAQLRTTVTHIMEEIKSLQELSAEVDQILRGKKQVHKVTGRCQGYTLDQIRLY